MAGNDGTAAPADPPATAPGVAAAQAAIGELIANAIPPGPPAPAAASAPAGHGLDFLDSAQIQGARYRLLWLIPGS